MSLKTYLHIFRRRASAIAVLAAVCLTAACGDETVATVDNEFEANRILDILHSKNIAIKKVPLEGELKGWNMVVDEGWFGEDEAATATQMLLDYGIPRPPEPEIKSTDPLGIISDSEEREKQKRELQRQVERQLYTFSDVIRASVIIAMPTDDVLSLNKTPPTASVSLVLKQMQANLTPEAVQQQVSGGVPNLKPENVKVTLTQQALREFPLEKLEAKRRSNKILALGVGVVTLLALSLGAVLLLAKRRREKPTADIGELTEGEEAEVLEMPERAMLNAREEK